MPIYEIAGIRVDMSPHFLRLKKQSEPYKIAESGTADMKISIPKAAWEKAKNRSSHLSEEELEYIFAGTIFYRKAIKYDAFLLHASAICHGGNAYLFSAPSGTGKSTHTAIWQETFSDVVYINDDKPLIVKTDAGFICAGTPFSGKTDKNTNLSVPLRAICALRRGQETKVHRLSPAETYYYVLDQTVRGVKNSEGLLEIAEQLVKSVPGYLVEVNQEPDAAQIVFDSISMMEGR